MPRPAKRVFLPLLLATAYFALIPPAQAVEPAKDWADQSGRDRYQRHIAEITVNNIDRWLTIEEANLLRQLAGAKSGRVGDKTIQSDGRKGGAWSYDWKNNRYFFRDEKDRRTLIEKLKAEIESPQLPAICSGRDGSIGVIRGIPHPLRLFKDDDAVLDPIRVIQAVDETNAILAQLKWWFWLESPLASTFRDDQEFASLPGLYQIKGRKTYTTVLGATKTIDWVAPYDASRRLDRARKDALRWFMGAPNEEAANPEPPVTYRKWHDAAGRYSIDAAFVSLAAGRVKLRTRDGKTITIQIDRLSRADRDWIDARRKAALRGR